MASRKCLRILKEDGDTFNFMGVQLSQRMREILFERMLFQEVGFFDHPDNSVGALSSRLQTDALLLRGAVGDSVGLVFQESATVIGCIVVAFVAKGSAWKLSLVVLSTIPLYCVALYMQRKLLGFNAANAGTDYALANNIATESALNIRVIQSFTMEQDVRQRYSDSLIPAHEKYIKEGNFNGLINGACNLIQFGVNALGIWYGGRLLARGELNVQQLFQAFFGIISIGQAIANSQITFPDVTKAGPAAQRIYQIIDRKPEIDAETDKGETLKEIKGRIDYKHINFVYPTRQEVTVFENFSLTCEAGKTTAMVGESGSGKSTVISLLQRFYDPIKGAVFLDGVNIQKLNLKWLRDNVALVAQEPILFNGTLIENIRIGRADATYEEAMEACDNANILSFVEKLPQKLDTTIGEKGIRLSGGQKQRVAIARAIIKRTNILLLDEATSALDANSEKVVQDALDRISKNRTTITIAHRLSTIRHADKIAVVQRGKLVEQGTHEQLIKIPDGVYNGLVKAQEGK